MAGPDQERVQEDRMRESVLADRNRAEQSRLMREQRTRHDAIGVAQHILDSRIRTVGAIQPELIGFMAVAVQGGGQLSPYEVNPIRDALLMKAMGSDVEKVQVKLVEARGITMEGMLTNPMLVSALRKHERDYDPDIGDRPIEMTSEEWEAFGQYQGLRDERQAIVDSMTNGVATLYDDKDDLERRIGKLEMRLEGLQSRQGNLTEKEREKYKGLLVTMFRTLKGPEATSYSRWAGRDKADLTTEEQVMLEDIWEKMMRALDGGEEGELEELERRGVKELGPDQQKLYDRRKQQLLDTVVDGEERDRLRKLLDTPYYEISEEESEAMDAKLQLAAEDAKMDSTELKIFMGLKDRRDMAKRLEGLRGKKVAGTLIKGERGLFEELHGKAGSLTEAETESIETIEDLIPQLKGRKGDIDKQIGEKMAKLGGSKEWMALATAFNGMVSNINVTDQWRRAWHDYGAGAQDSFTQTRWAEYQRVSELVALMEMPGVGKAMQEAFRAMCLIGLNKEKEVPGAQNIMQMEKLTQDQIEQQFLKPIGDYVKGRIGAGSEDLYVGFGVEMARMLFENSLAAGWFGLKRDNEGNIIYVEGGRENSDFASAAYKYGEAVTGGADGTVYADRQNDYIKLVGTRAKQMNEFSKGYETGLPALVPVLPDSLVSPWISHGDMVAIANGTKTLVGVFRETKDGVAKKPENSRWGWAYGVFRGAQVYDTVSKFIVGLKGFRNAAEEVDFFLKSPSNLGSLAKKIDVAFGTDIKEAQRFKMNTVMALIYSVYQNFSIPDRDSELKTVVPSSSEAQSLSLVSFRKDDFARLFVRTGFIDGRTWNELWDKRLKQLDLGKGGKVGMGMIKRTENLAVYKGEIEVKVARQKRREDLADQV